MFKLLTLIAITFSPMTVLAWGISTAFDSEFKTARLITGLRERKSIFYCVEIIKDWKVTSESIEAQTESALNLWLAPLKPQGVAMEKLTKSDCSDKNIDLKVVVGRLGGRSKNIAAGFYQVISQEPRFYSQISIDTEFTYEQDEVKYTMTDFANLLSLGTGELPKVLRKISFVEAVNVLQFSINKQLDYQRVWHSTYNVLIHEMGHAFGLCDTYKGTSDLIRASNDCQKEYLEKDHPISVMKNADNFALYDDDKTGIVELFKKYAGLSSR